MLTKPRQAQLLAERAVHLKRELNRLEAKQKKIEQELDQVLLQIPKTFINERIQNIPYDGATVYFQRNVQLSKKKNVPREQLLNLLVRHGYGEFVSQTYNAKGLKSLLVEYDRELREEGYTGDWKEGILKKFPKEIFELLNVHEELKGRIRNP